MLEIGVTIIVLAVVMTLITDTLSSAAKMMRPAKRREKIQVADQR